MKTLYALLLATFTIASAHAAGGTEIAGGLPKLPEFDLEGKTFCRKIVSDGMFGQPKGERKHCISFSDGIATDGANTFFGNPPESAPYEIRGYTVAFGDSVYEISIYQDEITTLEGSTHEGTVFTLE